MATIPSRVYKTVEWAMFNQNAMREELQAYRDGVLDGLDKPLMPGRTGAGIGYHSDTTALAALRIVEGGSHDLRLYRRWIAVCEAVRAYYAGTSYGELIRLYYDEQLKDMAVCRELHVERSTFYAMKSDIVATAWRVAVEKRLLKAFVS